MNIEDLEARLNYLRQAEAMGWSELHAIQGRIAEIEQWIRDLTNKAENAPAAE